MLQYIHENINNTKDKVTKSNFEANYFSKRELQILGLVCKQMTAKDIADKLFLSPRTVEGHRNNLLLKTDSKNIAGLVIYALKNKLIDFENDININ
ncbi:helix-turn-helix transcriptional regulator [Winogradskyella sp.]|uniref:response regulator transcription factor n=1 Tax=Winogradskyella sp. TaxID=1883156 RepID=UPI0025D6BD41|nr:helix-turn-helix transcriptional regulator [Winogradskyella sp.]